MKLTVIDDRGQWDGFVGSSPYGHPLQLWGWGEVKRLNHWRPVRLGFVTGNQVQAGAQMLLWTVPKLGRTIAYIPRGPVVEPGSPLARQLLKELAEYAKAEKAIYLRIEPAWTQHEPPKPWRRSRQTILMDQTYTFDLTRSEDEIMMAMKHKTRQYVRKSSGELVFELDESGQYLKQVYEIYGQTAARAGFGLHSFNYYQEIFTHLGQANRLFVAKSGDAVVAFLWLAVAGETAFELYGGINDQGSELKANYGLKWEAITRLKAAGLKVYDFNGRLEGGVSRFKAGFGPTETDYVGSYDLPFSRGMYLAWDRLWPVAKPLGRQIMKAVKR